MSERARPWWASDETVDRLAGDEDPLERARAARRGHPEDDDAAGAGAPGGAPHWRGAAGTVARVAQDLARTAESHDGRAGDREPDAGSGADAGADGAGEPADGPATGGERADTAGPGAAAGEPGHHVDVCGVCPVCTGLRALAESRPELVGHLAEAARHVALAARALRERPPTPPPDAQERDESPRSGHEPLQHIDLE